MRVLATAAVMLSCLLPTLVHAEEAASETTPTEYLQRLVEGHRLFANNEHDGALRAYRGALQAMSDDPLATYLVACSLRATDNLDEALSSFQRAATLSRDDDALHARALFNVALVQEARREYEAAREAWRAYIAYAEAHQDITTYVANARQRLDAITAIEELNAAYEPVRQRIAARAASESAGN